MKLIMEGWRNFINENSAYYDLVDRFPNIGDERLRDIIGFVRGFSDEEGLADAETAHGAVAQKYEGEELEFAQGLVDVNHDLYKRTQASNEKLRQHTAAMRAQLDDAEI